MTLQEILNTVTTHLLEQGERASNGKQSFYRLTKQGKTLKCAIGCLIPDNRYHPSIEGKSVCCYSKCDFKVNTKGKIELSWAKEDEFFCRILYLSGIAENITFLARLEALHDKFEPNEWAGEIVKIASDFHLAAP